MGKTLLCFFLLLAGAANSQIVNFPPDSSLKARLLLAGTVRPYLHVARNQWGGSMTIDANNDGEIQVAEAMAVHYLTLESIVYSFDGLEAFQNLRKLTITSAIDVDELDVSQLTNLENINISYSTISTLTLGNMPNLTNLVCDYNNTAPIDTSGVPNLTVYSFIAGGATTMEVSALVNLVQLRTGGTIRSVDLHGPARLKSIQFEDTIITSFDLSAAPYLEGFQVLSGYGAPNLTALDFSMCDSLQTLNISAAPLMTSLNIGQKRNGLYIELFNTAITELDLSRCPELSLHIYGNSNLSFINIKNGTADNIQYAESNSPDLLWCTDEEDEPISSGVQGNRTTYCSFGPGGEYNTVTGAFIFDADNNGCNASDNNIPFGIVTIANGTDLGTSVTNTGEYTFYAQAGTFTITPQFENEWFTTSPATVSFETAGNSTVNQNFCVTASGVHNDAEIIIVPLINAQPGFDASYKIVYKNKGNQTLSGDITFAYDDAVLDYVSASPAQATATPGSLTWNYSGLLPFESREILVTLNINGPMETPGVNIDDTLVFTASATPSAGDETPLDNTFAFKHVVTGSFDPNDIMCLEGAAVSPGKIGKYLHYNINFENTGNASATFVVVKDVIDPREI